MSSSESVFVRRRGLCRLVEEGALDSRVLDLILPNGTPLPDEDVYWDYKLELPGPVPKSSPDQTRRLVDAKFAELVKDVVAFYNSFGGYLLVGISDDRQLTGWPQNFDAGDLNKRVFGCTAASIETKFRTLKFAATDIGLLYVPRRSDNVDPAQFKKSAPESPSSRRAFLANDIYMRVRDECRPAISAADLAFLFHSGRRFHGSPSEPSDMGFIDNNLPDRDPNLIEIIRREKYLDALWRWFTDRYTAVKLLSGPGGVGKTTIARAFCEDVGRNAPAGISKIVWLTAKKRTIAPLLDDYVELTNDFDSLPTLLLAILSELSVPEAEMPSVEDRNGLIEAVIVHLKEFPCLLVVDDVDSLPGEAQSDVFRTIWMIFDRVIAAGFSRARALLTARLRLGAAPGQLLVVDGLPFDEFKLYVQACLESLGLPAPAALSSELKRLHAASSGSPLFAASILKLVAEGESLSGAINQWKGAEGEEVRRFAFKREIGELSDSAVRTLFAIQLLGQTSMVELLEVTQSSRTVLRDDLGKLREFHLLAGNLTIDAFRTGATVEVPNVISVMSDVIRQRVRDPNVIERACARVRRQSKGFHSEVARTVQQVVAFWNSSDFDLALEVAERAVSRIKNHPDLHCLLGRAYLLAPGPDLRKADAALRTARELGCSRPELFPTWQRVKEQIPDWVGLVEICREAEKEFPSPDNILLMARAYGALGDMAEASQSWLVAADNYRKGIVEINRAFDEGRAHGRVEALADLQRVLSLNLIYATDRGVGDPAQKIDVWHMSVEVFNMRVYLQEVIQLGAQRLQDWWSAATLRERFDASTARKLKSELRVLGSIVFTIDRDFVRWGGTARILKSTHTRLNQNLQSYEREMGLS